MTLLIFASWVARITGVSHGARLLNWKCYSSAMAPALQAQNPEFKPQSHKKKRSIVETWFLFIIWLIPLKHVYWWENAARLWSNLTLDAKDTDSRSSK
jgi:hypothetical protein